jgi:exopolysaccharide production protein ExoZ
MTTFRFDALQILRGLAAALVAYQHAVVNWASKGAAAGAAPVLLQVGEFGVKLFFCISGFIIVHTAARLPQGWPSTRTFWLRRLERIAPLYWVITLLYVAKNALAGQGNSAAEVFKSLAFIPYVNREGLVQPILGLGWSLNFEMFFYLLFGALFLLPRRWHLSAAVGLMTGLFAARALGCLGDGSDPHVLYHWADVMILYFVAGMLASPVAQYWREKGWPRLGQDAAAFVIVAWVLFYAGWVLRAFPAPAVTWMPLASALPVLVCVTARTGPCSAPWRPLIAAGDASYSTYLAHGFVLAPLARGFKALGWSIGYHGFAWLSLLVCSLAGYAVYRGLERRLTLRWWKQALPARTMRAWGFSNR